MTDESTLRKAFVDSLDIAPDTDWESLSYRGIEEWDSVAHMRLIAELEDVFDIMIETEDVIDMNSYVVARKLLGKYGIDFA
ncbi:acyl carrier protein [Pseudonocardia sp. TRM90224]|uniref:acyl carrier protein n=1 Tax=Pseudonocardia sp. TRM90224 TaxID=2812678 RepID=UPI001E2FDF1F|nr:acyl carrier protein [Pseudonocardia sp. TRM90224]